jgi:uncharacterized protein YjbI with pentapeptide repeats
MAGEPWGPLTDVVTGDLAAGEFRFDRRTIASGRLAPMAVYAFDGVSASDSSFDLTEVALTVQNSEFTQCRFRQARRPSSDGSWGQGSLARRPTVYRDCTFEGVRLRIRAGFSVGAARFERCAFVDCDFGEHFSFCADYIDCTFVGRVAKAVFYGTAPDGHRCDGKRNTIIGNDFSSADLRDVGFRGGVSLDAQSWPEGFDPSSLIMAEW